MSSEKHIYTGTMPFRGIPGQPIYPVRVEIGDVDNPPLTVLVTFLVDGQPSLTVDTAHPYHYVREALLELIHDYGLNLD